MVDYRYSGVSRGKGDITMKLRNGVLNLARALNKNTGLILIGILIFFGASILQFQSDSQSLQSGNQKLLENTSTTVSQLKRVLCEEIPQEQCNLSQAVAEIKEDNKTLKRYISCLLAAHGQEEQIDPNVETQCEKMSANVDLQDVTRSNTAPESSNQNTNTNNKSATSQEENKQQPAPEQKPPAEVLGFPLCVPFTNRCIR